MRTAAQVRLSQIHALLYQIIASREGLWQEIAQLANDADYLLIENPLKSVEARLCVSEQSIGRTMSTSSLRDMITSARKVASLQQA